MGRAIAIAALPLAWVLDLAFGEPRSALHPVAWLGRALAPVGRRLRAGSPACAFVGGALVWLGCAIALGTGAWWIQAQLPGASPSLGVPLLAPLLKPTFAWRMLRDEVTAVERAPENGLAEGRARLARIVRRNVSALDADAIRETAIESLAENLNDPPVAPLLWYAAAGLPGAVVYRFANTLDAMWGYRGRWECAGKWSARVDDVLSWRPARFTALLLMPLRPAGAGGRAAGRGGAHAVAEWRLADGRDGADAGRAAAQAGCLCVERRRAIAMRRGRGRGQPGRHTRRLVGTARRDACRRGQVAVTARAVMVLGTTSNAGKSWLATALCRWYARQGLKVAPFKAQNMSNNARVVPTPSGAMGEIGSAQYFQALAARAEPEVRMNPVLLKPEHDTASQVIVLGEVRAELAQLPWRERGEVLWPFARGALQALMRENDVVVIEGAGSPAEINLHASDYVNMRTARAANAACLLVTDIDRGGAFAHLYGTHQLLPADKRALIRGFVLNRFRGDAALLAPGPQQLQQLTGVPTLAVLPMWRGHGLPEEDGVFDERPGGDADGVQIAVIAFPRISNLDEFQPLRDAAGVRLRWVRTPGELMGADWIVLPGSKHTSGDLAWLRAQRLDAAIARHAAAGGRVLGLCGGLQMLGDALVDPDGVDGDARGLGLLPLHTRFERLKLLRHTAARFGDTAGAWAALAGVGFEGYEIRHGRSTLVENAVDTIVALRNDAGESIGWQRGNVLGLYMHGLFESPAVLRALFGREPRTLESVFDGLADFIDTCFDPGALARLVEP